MIWEIGEDGQSLCCKVEIAREVFQLTKVLEAEARRPLRGMLEPSRFCGKTLMLPPHRGIGICQIALN